MAPGKIKFKTRRQDIATVTWPRIRKRKFALDTQSRKKPFVDLSCKPEGVKTSPPLQGWKSSIKGDVKKKILLSIRKEDLVSDIQPSLAALRLGAWA